MSLFGAMTTAISGLNAQSAAFTNISDNTANSQTVGYKSVDTSFIDYLTQSTASQNLSGSVGTRPEYQNELQGTIQQSTDPLALAISGQGFFAVSQPASISAGGTPVFTTSREYTRAGDFTLDANNYLVNSAGNYLNGWTVTNGVPNTSALVPIQVSNAPYPPVATSAVTLAENIPATPAQGANLTSNVQVYDSNGAAHQLAETWAQTGANAWTLSFSAPDNVGGAALGSVAVTFNADGTLASLSNAQGGVTVTGGGGTASLQVAPNFGGGAQPITIGLGQFGVPGGVTQYAGTSLSLGAISQNGAPAGNFTGASITSSGDVVANYDNGQAVTVAHVPLVTFADANALQRQNGQAFTPTVTSGQALVQNAGQGNTGTLVTGSVEQSNVDIATELSKLIVAQQAYGANAKVITTANQMLLTTLDIKQ